MTLVQKSVQKISAFIAGAIAFVVLWLAISPSPSLLGIVHERVAFSVFASLVVALIFDSVIDGLATLRQGQEAPGGKKTRSSKTDDENKTAFLCPNCGQTYTKPVRIMDPRTEKYLYSVCPKCTKPLNSQPPPPPVPIVAAAVPTPTPMAPAEAAKALTVPDAAPEPPKEPAKVKKPMRIEILVHQPDEE